MSIESVPILGSVVGLFKSFERGVNSSEHNFKNDLSGTLIEQYGVDPQTAKTIHEVLDTGSDEGLGDRLRALIALDVIPAEAIPAINQLAAQNGVPASSIDTEKMYEPMSVSEAVTHMEPKHVRELGRGEVFDQIQSQRTWEAQRRAGAAYGFGMNY